MLAWSYPRLIAHRCGGALAPENTLVGLLVAARMGVRAVEFDVMLSADGFPFLIHDETLERTTNGCGAVADQSAAQLRQLDAGVRHHPAFAGEPIPTLEDALAHCLRLGLAANIEIKPAPGQEAETGRVVVKTIQAFLNGQGALPLLLSSFSQEALAAANEAGAQAAGLPLAMLFEAVPADWQAVLHRLDCSFVHCDAARLDARQLAEIRSAGVELACYTVNDPQAAQRLYAAGVAAVFSDRPDLLLE